MNGWVSKAHDLDWGIIVTDTRRDLWLELTARFYANNSSSSGFRQGSSGPFLGGKFVELTAPSKSYTILSPYEASTPIWVQSPRVHVNAVTPLPSACALERSLAWRLGTSGSPQVFNPRGAAAKPSNVRKKARLDPQAHESSAHVP